MSDFSLNEIESDVFATLEVSVLEEPNIKDDWSNFLLLTLLYLMQGVSLGFTNAFSLSLQGTDMVTHDDLALFSIVLWSYSLKLFWAPLVDRYYVKKIGRRKSWLLPLQYLIGTCFLYFAFNIDDWLPKSGKPKIKAIVIILFVINFLCATQDIVVDSWTLTMLKKHNMSYASTFSSIGQAFGMFIGSICPILLAYEKFWNKYIQSTPGTGGVISIKSYLYFCGFVFLLITTLIGIFKKEEKNGLNVDHEDISIFQSYKLIWDILNIPYMKVLVISVLTSIAGSSTPESVVSLRLIDAGLCEEVIMIITTLMYVLKIFIPIFVIKFTGGPEPVSFYLKLMPLRLIWSNFAFAGLVYFTKSVIELNGPDCEQYLPFIYYMIIGFVFSINELICYTMLIAILGYFNRISDARFGGTYITLLNTVRSIGWAVPNTINLKMIDVLTFDVCSNDVQNTTSDSAKFDAHEHHENCVMVVDGYYIEVVACLMIGFAWYGIFNKRLKIIESFDRSHWLIDLNRRGH